MTSRVEKAGSLRFKPSARAGPSSEVRQAEAGGSSSGGNINNVSSSSVRASVEPLPIGRRTSVTPSPSSTATGAERRTTTKSYALGGGSGAGKGKGKGGVPIFVGSGAHSHAQSQRASMGPPPPLRAASSRRSQTPQLQSSQRAGSVAREQERDQPQLQPPPFYPGLTSTPDGEEQHSQQPPANGAAEAPATQDTQSRKRQSQSQSKRAPGREASQGRSNVVDDDDDDDDDDDEASQAEAKKAKPSSRGAPRRPGNPPSAYVLFSRKVRPRISEEAGTEEGASFSIAARVRQEWQALTGVERTEFEEEASQRKQVWESVMEDWKSRNPDAANESSTTRKRAGSRKSRPAEPVPPSKDAFQLFQLAYQAEEGRHLSGDGDVQAAWDGLSEEDRNRYVQQEQEAEERYVAEKEEWERGQGRLETKSRQKPRTISDDEADYLAEVDAHGPALKARRVDSRNTAMADLSAPTYKRGRASKRTFDMERKLKAVARDRKRQLREERATRDSGADGLGRKEGERSGQGRRETPLQSGQGQREEPEEEIIDEGEGESQSDNESVGATSVASSHQPALRDNRFTIRTRIVNGQIVLDESSLQQERSNAASMDGMGQEYVDVNESDRFVNSATYSKRVGTERWDAHETGLFLKAVSMWGSDFEMISRMFPNRNRKQIRAKWRSMERTDSHSLDLAFKRKLPVDLEEYGLMAGVDLTGEAPQIEAKVIKKAEEEGEGEEEQDVEEQRQVELDENGLEIVEEGDEEPLRTVIRKKSTTPARLAKSKSPSVPAETDGEEEELPTAEEAARSALASRETAQRDRAQSTSSFTSSSHRPRSNSTLGANVAEVERLRVEKKQQELQRKERERARRRSVPTNEEEVIG